MIVKELVEKLLTMNQNKEIDIVLFGDTDGSPRQKEGFYSGLARSVIESEEMVTISQENY